MFNIKFLDKLFEKKEPQPKAKTTKFKSPKNNCHYERFLAEAFQIEMFFKNMKRSSIRRLTATAFPKMTPVAVEMRTSRSYNIYKKLREYGYEIKLIKNERPSN